MDNNSKFTKAFEKYTAKAKNLVNDSDGIRDLMSKLDDKMESVPQVGPVWDNLKVMVEMLAAYARGEYKQVPGKTIAAIIGTLLYILNPIDLMMDVIPVVGFADDIAIIVLAYNLAKPDIEKYNRWLIENNKIDVEIEFEHVEDKPVETEATEIKFED